jgi:membrane protein
VGYLVQYQIATHQVNIHDLLQRFLPGNTTAFDRIEDALGHLVAQRGRITLIGVPLFLWFSTRLFGGLRAALNEVFDTDERRPWPVAKALDLSMVLVTGVLLVANAYLTTVPGLGAHVEALALGTLLFFLIFKFLPSRQIYWRTGLVASLFCAVASEIVKRLFAFYVSRFATLNNLASDANLVGFLLFLLWIYYTAYVFLLGGEVAETYDLMRMRRLQRVQLK